MNLSPAKTGSPVDMRKKQAITRHQDNLTGNVLRDFNYRPVGAQDLCSCILSTEQIGQVDDKFCLDGDLVGGGNSKPALRFNRLEQSPIHRVLTKLPIVVCTTIVTLQRPRALSCQGREIKRAGISASVM